MKRKFVIQFFQVIIISISISLFYSVTAYADRGDTTLVSINSGEFEGNNDSSYPSISSGGRYVAFSSTATNLVAGDNNGHSDIFVHDRQERRTTRVSINSDGGEGYNDSSYPSISSDGRYVAFSSTATNLVAGDNNGRSDIFVHDRQERKTTRVSINSDGGEGHGRSRRPSISSDGRYVAFESPAINLVAGDNNGHSDIFVHDRQDRKTTRVSINSDGVEGNNDSSYPSISSDGRYVAFSSTATNLVAGDNSSHSSVFVHQFLAIEEPALRRNFSPPPPDTD
jgi:Tol biopolymer transport system component